jgi:hypothetical protein
MIHILFDLSIIVLVIIMLSLLIIILREDKKHKLILKKIKSYGKEKKPSNHWKNASKST